MNLMFLFCPAEIDAHLASKLKWLGIEKNLGRYERDMDMRKHGSAY